VDGRQAGNELDRFVKCRRAIPYTYTLYRTQAMARRAKPKYEPLASNRDHRPEWPPEQLRVAAQASRRPNENHSVCKNGAICQEMIRT